MKKFTTYLTPHVVSTGLLVVALPITIILAITTQNIQQYAATYESPVMKAIVKKQQALIADQTQLLQQLNQDIAETDVADTTAPFAACGSTVQPSAVLPTDTTATDQQFAQADAADVQAETALVAQADAITIATTDSPLLQLEKGIDKITVLQNAIKARQKRHTKHCKHHHKGGGGTPTPSTSPKPTKTPKSSPTPSVALSPSVSPSPATSPSPVISPGS